MKSNKSDVPPVLSAAVLTILGSFCLLTGAYLGLKLSRNFRENPPRRIRQTETDVNTIQEWMTLRYISRVYGTPEPELEKRLHLKPLTYQQSSLAQIATELNVNKEIFIEEVRQAITEFQNTHPQPPL